MAKGLMQEHGFSEFSYFVEQLIRDKIQEMNEAKERKNIELISHATSIDPEVIRRAIRAGVKQVEKK